MEEQITVYGTESCRDTARTRRYLERLGVDYEFVNIDEDERAASFVENANRGKRRVPTVEIAVDHDRQVLSVPSETELSNAIGTDETIQ